ncbi:hypothetical protein AAE478_009143 [Parahypoxylon ruwenzoriense]
MPPILPRPSAFLPRGGAASSTISRVLYSSTAAARSSNQQAIPPESPLFINVPNPPQDQSIEARRELKPIKGHLPIPRPLFKHRGNHVKKEDEWLQRSAPLPTSEKATQPPRSGIQAFKRLMAANRRENMREGIRGLYQRKQLFDKRRRERQAANLAAHKAAAATPEREDERLTRATVNEGTLQTRVMLDPYRFERAQESRLRTEAIMQQKSEARRDAIQELYMRARSFIVTEQELETEVNRLFAPDYWKKMGLSSSGFEVNNIWDLEGKPTTVADMFDEVARTSNSLVKNLESEKTRTLKRQKEVAEELTGGKLDGI